MTTRFLIHPGYPKTGTTSLQANVFAGHSGIKYLSNHSAPGNTFRDAPRTAEFHALLRDWNVQNQTRIDDLWAHHFMPEVHPLKLNVISDETFLNNEGPFNEIANHVHRLVGAAKVLIVLRPQADILRSMYDMYPWLKGDPARRYLRFPEWLRATLAAAPQNIAGVLRYVEVVTHYRKTFGQCNVMVVAYSKLFNDTNVQAELCAWLGIDALEFSTGIVKPPVNTSTDHNTKKLVRRILGPVKGSTFLTPGQIQAIRLMLSSISPNRKTEVTKADLDTIDEFYAGQRIIDLPEFCSEGLLL